MKSLLLRLLILGFITAALWLLAERYTGSVIINWLGYEIVLAMSFVLPALVVLVVVLVEIDRAWLWVVGIPKRFIRKRKEKKAIRGAQLIMEGLNAIAADDAVTARKISRQALQMIGSETAEFHAMATLLAAQTAEIDGNDEVAIGYYRGMMDGPARFLAMAGLLKIFVKNIPANKPETREKTGEAIRMAEQALKLQPNSSWLVAMATDLYSRYGENKKAIDLLERARKKSIMSDDEVRKKLAAIYTESAAENLDNNRAMAITFASKALDMMASHTPAVLLLANAHQKAGDSDAAIKAIEKSWRYAASQALAERYLRLLSDVEPEKRLKRVRKMTADNHADIESIALLASASVAAGDYVSARQHVRDALKIAPDSPRVKQLVAELDKAR